MSTELDKISLETRLSRAVKEYEEIRHVSNDLFERNNALLARARAAEALLGEAANLMGNSVIRDDIVAHLKNIAGEK